MRQDWELLEFIRTGNQNGVRACHKKDPHCLSGHRDIALSAMSAAAFMGRVEMIIFIDYLVGQPAYIPDADGMNPLHLLFAPVKCRNRSGYHDQTVPIMTEARLILITHLLIKLGGVNIADLDRVHRTGLHYACAEDHHELIPDLCNNELINAQDLEGNTPLHIACMAGHANSVIILSSFSPTIQQNKEGNTVHHIMAAQGQRLLKVYQTFPSDNSINLLNHKGEHPLTIAAQKDNLPFCKVILREYKMLLPQSESPIQFLLEKAVDHSADNLVWFSCQRGADPNKKNEDGFSMLAKAAQNNHSNTMEALLANGADPNISRSPMGVSTIWWTAFKKNVKMFLLFSYASAANLANQWPEKLGHASQQLQSFILVARFMSFEEMPNTWQHLLPDIPPDQMPNLLQMMLDKRRFYSVCGTVNACPAQNSWNELSKQNHEHLKRLGAKKSQLVWLCLFPDCCLRHAALRPDIDEKTNAAALAELLCGLPLQKEPIQEIKNTLTAQGITLSQKQLELIIAILQRQKVQQTSAQEITHQNLSIPPTILSHILSFLSPIPKTSWDLSIALNQKLKEANKPSAAKEIRGILLDRNFFINRWIFSLIYKVCCGNNQGHPSMNIELIDTLFPKVQQTSVQKITHQNLSIPPTILSHILSFLSPIPKTSWDLSIALNQKLKLAFPLWLRLFRQPEYHKYIRLFLQTCGAIDLDSRSVSDFQHLSRAVESQPPPHQYTKAQGCPIQSSHGHLPVYIRGHPRHN